MKNTTDRVILGIDPGTNIMGFGILAIDTSGPKALALGVVDLRKKHDPYLKLQEIFNETVALIDKYHPDELAIESPFFGKNVQSMLKLGRAQGWPSPRRCRGRSPFSNMHPGRSRWPSPVRGLHPSNRWPHCFVRSSPFNRKSSTSMPRMPWRRHSVIFTRTTS